MERAPLSGSFWEAHAGLVNGLPHACWSQSGPQAGETRAAPTRWAEGPRASCPGRWDSQVEAGCDGMCPQLLPTPWLVPCPQTQPRQVSLSPEQICPGQRGCPKQGGCREVLLWVWNFYFHRKKKGNVRKLLSDLPCLSSPCLGMVTTCHSLESQGAYVPSLGGVAQSAETRCCLSRTCWALTEAWHSEGSEGGSGSLS